MPRRKFTHALAAASFTLCGLPLSAYAVVQNPDATMSQTPPSVIVFNQKPKGNELSVTYAYMPSAGHLVIHNSEGGKVGRDVVGSVKLEAGDHHNIAVKLDKALPSGTSLWASLTDSQKRPFEQTLPLQNEFRIE